MPPVLACDDGLAFSPLVDAALLVAADGETDEGVAPREAPIGKDGHLGHRAQ
jgi:hypothetical protein